MECRAARSGTETATESLFESVAYIKLQSNVLSSIKLQSNNHWHQADSPCAVATNTICTKFLSKVHCANGHFNIPILPLAKCCIVALQCQQCAVFC
eukprot:15344660-Ditylum_brightwellii.AAC.1